MDVRDVLTCIEYRAKIAPPKKRKRRNFEAADPDSPEIQKDDKKQTPNEDKTNDDPDDLKLKCPFCEKQSPSIEDYLQHQKAHPPSETREVYKLYCNACSYNTTVIDHLRKHMMRHYNVKPFKCPMCSWRCVTKYQLQQHHIHHHLNLKKSRPK